MFLIVPLKLFNENVKKESDIFLSETNQTDRRNLAKSDYTIGADWMFLSVPGEVTYSRNICCNVAASHNQ